MCLIESGSLEFALKLYKQLASDENLVFSPLSLTTCLSMLLMGTRTTSAEELSNMLFSNSIDGSDMESVAKQWHNYSKKCQKTYSKALSSANLMYTQKEFQLLPTFQKCLEKYFSAKAKELDFQNSKNAALDVINRDIKVATNSKIDKILEYVEEDTVLVLVNALYFNGIWRSKFKKHKTITSRFKTNTDHQICVEFMRQSNTFPFVYSPDLKATAIELSYKNTSSVLMVVLPDEDYSLAQMRPQLTIASINALAKSLRAVKVDLWLPKLRLESTLALIPMLKKLGINGIFESKSADFSALTDRTGFYVSTIVQKAVIKFDEEGTEMFSLTSHKLIYVGVDYTEIFRADRPFLFLLVTKDEENCVNSIALIGECNNPNI